MIKATKAAIVLSLVWLPACDGSDSVVSVPPADVAGIWRVSSPNAHLATFTFCFGDDEITALMGRTIAERAELATICRPIGGLNVTQDDSLFTIFNSLAFVCSSSKFVFSDGSGSVNGNSIQGQFDTDYIFEDIDRAERFSGTIDGSSMTLLEDRMRWTGAIEGRCEITPPTWPQIPAVTRVLVPIVSRRKGNHPPAPLTVYKLSKT